MYMQASQLNGIIKFITDRESFVQLWYMFIKNSEQTHLFHDIL